MAVTLAQAIAQIGTVAANMSLVEQAALTVAAQMVQEEAQRVIGTYDYGWPPLAESTLKKKDADTPLLETGEMRDSIEYTVMRREAQVGSNNQKAVWQELGTKTIPPRSFLMGAAMHEENAIHQATGRIFHAALNFSAPFPYAHFSGMATPTVGPSLRRIIPRGR